MTSPDLHEFRDRYRRLSNYQIADLYAQGPSAFASPAIWELLELEFRDRGDAIATDVEQARERVGAKAAEEEARRVTLTAYAPFYTRTPAAIVDLIIVGLLAFLVGITTDFLGADGTDAFEIVFWGLLLFVYHPLFEMRSGATPGKRLFRLKVVTTTGRLPSIGPLMLRSVLRPFGLFGLLWYLIWRTPWGQDVVSGTRVVTVPTSSIRHSRVELPH